MTRKPAPFLLCLCLGLALVLLGLPPAVACPEPVTAVVACGHGGIVWLDAAGKPVDPACRHCPDCLGGSAALLPAAVPAPAQKAPRPGRRGAAPFALPPFALLHAPSARGPPPGSEV